METQFITDIKGHKTKAIISIEDYNHFIKLLEEEDCKLYDEAKKDVHEKTYTLEEVAEDIGYEL
ncbi:MAG: hypothetical protein GDA42_09035 [Ekhidna sp.]|nr:hypothetical protein [Ekhidna sp.]MBC6410583.1 hypothetical protein [Ekhidna sp.]